MIIDSHLHIGWFTDGYHHPLKVIQAEKAAGISEMAVSSTSTCAECYKLVVREMKQLIKTYPNSIHPILWITPRMMKTYGISFMLHSGIQWEGIKMHWEAHREWYYNTKLLRQCMQLVRKLGVPVLLHTGEARECQAHVFQSLCNEYRDITFVLAHGRPRSEIEEVLRKCSNAFVDTAFMDVDEISALVGKGYIGRILFGTDAPINRIFFPSLSTEQYLKKRINELRNEIGVSNFNSIANHTIYHKR